MKYMGGKSKLAKHILPIILEGRKERQYYVEPFCGGCNIIDKVAGNRIAADSNDYLIHMWANLASGWNPPTSLTRSEYNSIRANPERYARRLVGWAAFNCSYSGKYFGGYAGKTKTKIGTVRDYQAEALRNVLRQVPLLEDVKFRCCSYSDLVIPDSSIVYCDPPYAGTTAYSDVIDYVNFWQWVRDLASVGHSVFVSEYQAPDDFRCVWEMPVKSSLSANGRSGGSKESIEQLFTT